MKLWYQRYFSLLTRLARSNWPPTLVLWLLLWCSFSWTGYWLLAEKRLGGELLLPILLSLWLLIGLFIRLVFNFQSPLLPAGAGWRAKWSQWWFLLKLHGTAWLILLLVFSCLLMSLKLLKVLWRSFG